MESDFRYLQKLKKADCRSSLFGLEQFTACIYLAPQSSLFQALPSFPVSPKMNLACRLAF